MLVTLDPDDPADPHTFEVPGDLRRATLHRGRRVEIDYEPVEHEVVDPDGPSESFGPQSERPKL